MCRVNVIPTVLKAVESECQFRRELPALLQLMNKPREVDPGIRALGDLSTVYRDNFNKESLMQISENSQELTFTQPADSANFSRISLNPCTKLLYAGTIKATTQLPGYKGHIPRNVRNPRKLEHSAGAVEHPVQNNLILTQRGMGGVLGYTGVSYLT